MDNIMEPSDQETDDNSESYHEEFSWSACSQAVLPDRSSLQTIELDSCASSPSRPTIVLVDDRKFIRECVARCLSATYENCSIAMFATSTECAHADIDLALVALVIYNIYHRRPSDPDVEENLERLGTIFAGVPIIILSDGEDADRVVEALERGVRGYIPTSATVEIALGAAHLISAGGTFVPADSFVTLTQSAGRPRASMPVAGRFTDRQLDVLRLVREGKANRAIAHELQMSESTVKAHVRNVMQKLKATNRTQITFLTRDLFAPTVCRP
jgi:DNA-binding NarL/FixJ family response regulator